MFVPISNIITKQDIEDEPYTFFWINLLGRPL